MSRPTKIGLAAAAGMVLAAGLTNPARAARIVSLECESHLQNFVCIADFRYTGLVDFAWYVNGQHQPLEHLQTMHWNHCSGGAYYDVKLIMTDDAGSATKTDTVRCERGNL